MATRIAAFAFLVATLALGVGCQDECEHEDETAPRSVPDEPGTYERALAHDGGERGYRLEIPSTYDAATASPMLVLFHGGGSSAPVFHRASLPLITIAEDFGTLVVLPDGHPGGDSNGFAAVHCCGSALRCNVDDVGFVESLIGRLSETLNVDATRRYASGFSNGAFLIHRIAAERPDLFAAIAPTAASVGGSVTIGDPHLEIDPVGPVPVMLVHGINDSSVTYGGGTGVNTTGDRVDMSFAESTALWVENNGCDTTPTTTTEPNGDDVVTVDAYTGCDDGADVTAATVEGMGHKWPRESNTGGWDGMQAIADFLLTYSN